MRQPAVLRLQQARDKRFGMVREIIDSMREVKLSGDLHNLDESMSQSRQEELLALWRVRVLGATNS